MGVTLLTGKANDFGGVASEPSLVHGVVHQMVTWAVVGGLLGLALVGLSGVLSPAAIMPHKDKVKKYECGFDPFQHGLSSFSVNFFRICILFLLFDLELVFLFPGCVILDALVWVHTWTHIGAMALFLGLLTVAFLFELNLDILAKL